MHRERPKLTAYRKRKTAEPVRLTFWGVRGSIPSPGSGTVRFGGNTTCVEIRADGQHLILDAGSGIRVLGQELLQEFGEKPLNLTILLTHTHWDHIQGFPFFQPAYQGKNNIRILGYEGARRSLQSTLEVQMESPYFPISFRDLPGHIVIEELKEHSFSIGKLKIQAAQTKHPGLTMGYRIETSAGVICFVPDHESAPGEPPGVIGDLIAGADVLVMDSQYTAEEYPKKAGWGHGCLDDVVRVACETGVKRLWLFHHDPIHDDEFIEGMVGRARELAYDHDLEIDAAREGEQVVLMSPAANPGTGTSEMGKH
jgi:phosphoribosyl 1,2-cyclic phosphodiesterase